MADNCDPNPVVTLKLIIMNEDDTTLPYHPEFDDSIEDGKTRNDIQIDSEGNI